MLEHYWLSRVSIGSVGSVLAQSDQYWVRRIRGSNGSALDHTDQYWIRAISAGSVGSVLGSEGSVLGQ